jgi:hypothetical protein
LDVKALQNSAVLGEKIPQELLDNIRGQLHCRCNKDVMQSQDQTELIKTLEPQVEEFYKAVNVLNKYFWSAMLRLGKAPISFSHAPPTRISLLEMMLHPVDSRLLLEP